MTSIRIVSRYDPVMPCLLAVALLMSQAPPVPIDVNGKPFAEIRFDTTKPYVYPIRTASGKVITRRFPMETVPGETTDHPHHRGLWFSHGDVNGWDFWANERSQEGVGKGRGEIKAGKVTLADGTAKFSATWDSPAGILLAEDRTMRFSGDASTRTIDVDVTLTAKQKVVFGDTKEGVFAIRLRDELAEKQGSGKITTAEGLTGMKAAWGKASPWVEYSGVLEGEPVAVRITDHPENPRHPTRWHVRDYGLFAANIFGLHDFLNDKTKDGSMTLEPEEKLRFRYRVTIGPPAK